MSLVEPFVNFLRPYQFRGKARLFNRFVPRTGVRTAWVHGFRMELDLAEHIQRMIYLGTYERWETRMVRRYLRPGMRFVDVGANVGYFTLLASRAVGSAGMVFAVEPSSYVADRLARTLTDNRIGNVRLDKIGLGKEPGECILYDPLPDNHTPTMLGDVGTSGKCVPIRPLDDCLADWGVGHVDLLKIDVEGYEPLVLEGASTALSAGRIRAILCEFNDYWLRRAGSTMSGLREELLGLGFVDVTDCPWDLTRPILNRFFVLPRRAPHSSKG